MFSDSWTPLYVGYTYAVQSVYNSTVLYIKLCMPSAAAGFRAKGCVPNCTKVLFMIGGVLFGVMLCHFECCLWIWQEWGQNEINSSERSVRACALIPTVSPVLSWRYTERWQAKETVSVLHFKQTLMLNPGCKTRPSCHCWYVLSSLKSQTHWVLQAMFHERRVKYENEENEMEK